MATDMPGPGAGPDQPEPATPAPVTPEPAWTTPPPPSAPGPGPAASGSWGTAPQQPGPAQPQQPAQQAPMWGQPAQTGSSGGAQQPAPPQQPAPQAPGWGAPPQQQPAPAQPQQPGQWGATPPPQQPAWNAAPQQPAPQPGQWGAPAAGYNAAPPPGQPPQQGWGAPGGPQPGWQGGPPPPKSSGNGCLKACLIVGVILVVIAVIAVIALFAVGSSFVSGLGVDSNGNLKDCSIVSTAQLQTVLGSDAQAAPLSGLANSTIGATLDKRILPNADNCWVGAGTSPDSTQTSGAFGRIAKYSGGDASSVFAQEKSKADAGGYLAADVPGAGDEAFCTGWSDYPATGALVRKGNDLVYVSFLIGENFTFDQASGDTGILYSPSACQDAVKIAELALK